MGFLYGALLALAAGNATEADTLFARALQQFDAVQPNDDLWITLMGFAAIAPTASAAAFEAFLTSRDMFDATPLAALPLPARSNFLRYCAKHQKLAPALVLVEAAGPEWEADQITLEAWGFRLAALAVLQGAQRDNQFAAYAASCQALLQRGGVEPSELQPGVEFQLALRMAEEARERGDARSAIAYYRAAVTIAEEKPAAGLDASVLADLLLTLGRYHQSLPYLPEAQRCFERSIGIGAIEGCKHQLVSGLFLLANLHARQGQYRDAAMLYAQRVWVMEGDPDFSEPARHFARHDLARALYANGDSATACRILDDIIAFAQDDASYNHGLLFMALLSRADFNLKEAVSAPPAWDVVRQITDLKQPLSANQLDQLAGLMLSAVRGGREPPPRELVIEIGKQAKAAEQENLPLAAGVALAIGAAALEFYDDIELADEFLRRGIAARDTVTERAAAAIELSRRIKNIKFRLVEKDLSTKPEMQLSADFASYLNEAATFSQADWQTALNLAANLFDQQRTSAAASIVTSVAASLAAGSALGSDVTAPLFARMSEMMLRLAKDAAAAAGLAQQGLATLAGKEDERSAALTRRLSESLALAEIALAEAMIGAAPEAELRQAVERILAAGAGLSYTSRVALLRLADRAFAGELAGIGGAIVGALADLPVPADPGGDPNAARLCAELFLRLSHLTLRHLKAMDRAAALAQRGLDALAAGGDADERSTALSRRLSTSLANAEKASARA